MKPILKMSIAESEAFNNTIKKVVVECELLQVSLNKIDNRSWFDKFYDAVGNFLNGGKSIAPNEMKVFK